MTQLHMILTGKTYKEIIEVIEEQEPLVFKCEFREFLNKPRVERHKHLADHRRGKEVRNG